MENNVIDEITTKDLLITINSPRLRIIDIRPAEAYNGWKLAGEKRGGHIKKAKSLPFKWTNYIDWIEIVRSKIILPSNEIVIYAYNKEESEQAARLFIRAGYDNVTLYNHFLDEWAENEALPMDNLAKYSNLVSANWLNTLIETGKAPEYENNKYVICHAHYQNISSYNEGHIPEAVDLDTNELESHKTWNRRTPEELDLTLRSLGISHDSTVVLYGRFSFPNKNDPFPGSSAGHLGAIRCATIMLYAGVKDVRILNGGLQAWTDAGFKKSTDFTRRKPVASFGLNIPGNPEIFVDTPEAKEMIAAPDKNLVCVRSWLEYIGEVSGYNYIEKKGRIPGALFASCGSDAYHMENYRNLDHTTREYQEIADRWKRSGITPDKHNAFYCGTGWRGSEAFLNAWLMGWSKVSVYDGGWFEWSNDENNLYETGMSDYSITD